MSEQPTTTAAEELAATSQPATDALATAAGDGGQPAAPATAAGTDAGNQPGTEGKSAEGAPDAYEFIAPEGATFDDAIIGAFSDVAKDLGLSQDSAQKVLDAMTPVMQARHAEQLEALSNSWAEQVTADPELGGDKLQESLATAKRAIDLAPPELREFLETTKLGNHPALFKWAVAVGKALSDDSLVTGDGAASSTADPAKRLFPNMS